MRGTNLGNHMKLGALVLVLLALAGCSSGTSKRPRASSPSPSISGSTPARPSGTASPTGGSRTSPRSTAKTTPKKSASPTFGPSSARLDKSCVHRGAQDDRQGITIKTDPGGPASYQTVYSDGSSIIDRPQYSSGGQNGGFADASGTYRDTWVVPASAPLGRATVRAVVAGRSDTIDMTFTIVGPSSSCP
jgi:hypothetical protein